MKDYGGKARARESQSERKRDTQRPRTRERERERERYLQTGGRTDRQTDRQTEKEEEGMEAIKLSRTEHAALQGLPLLVQRSMYYPEYRPILAEQ